MAPTSAPPTLTVASLTRCITARMQRALAQTKSSCSQEAMFNTAAA
jgi:hypothetical protein